jgi:hypothetical protein
MKPPLENFNQKGQYLGERLDIQILSRHSIIYCVRDYESNENR